MKNPDVDMTIRFTIQDFLALNLVPRVLSYPPDGSPTERERAGRREPWERGCLALSPALAAKLWISTLFKMRNSFYQLN